MAKRYYKVNIEISNICNLQCSFCPEVIRPKAMMEPGLFRRIIEQVAPVTKLVTLHLMGEPLVHPKLDELIEICDANQVRIFFVTNGVLLREKESELLLHSAIRQVSFSLHSFYDNFTDKDIEPYLQKVFAFTRRAATERPRMFINYRLWNLQNSRGGEARNLEILSRIEKHFGVTIPREINPLQKKSFQIQDHLYLHFDTEFTWPALDLPLLGETGTCYGLQSHFGILVDGTVVPCCLDKEAAIPLGNLQTQDLNEILESPRALKMVAGFKQNKLIEELCRRCQYIERFQTIQN